MRNLKRSRNAAPAAFGGAELCHVLAAVLDPSSIRRDGAGDEIEQGGLSRAVRSQDADDFRRGYHEIDVLSDDKCPVPLGQPGDGQQAHGRFSRRNKVASTAVRNASIDSSLGNAAARLRLFATRL